MCCIKNTTYWLSYLLRNNSLLENHYLKIKQEEGNDKKTGCYEVKKIVVQSGCLDVSTKK